MRLENRLRRNGDYQALRALADEYGLGFRICKGGRFGHPRVMFSNEGAEIWVPVASSASGVVNMANVRARALKRLRKFGIIPDRLTAGRTS